MSRKHKPTYALTWTQQELPLISSVTRQYRGQFAASLGLSVFLVLFGSLRFKGSL